MTAVTEGTGRPDDKKAAAERRADRAGNAGAKAAAELAAAGALDGLFATIDSGEIELTVRGRSPQPWFPTAVGGSQGSTMPISLCVGGTTVRDIGHYLASTIGTELSHETISTITERLPRISRSGSPGR